MPVEFLQQEPSGGSSHATRLVMMYDGSGRRISKTAMRMVGDDDWDTTLVTHYTGIGTEIREYKPRNFVRYTDSAGVEHCVSANPDYGGNASTACPLPDTVKVAMPLPQGLGRYALQDAATMDSSLQGAYEFYLKDHLGSTRMVYGVGYPDPLGLSPLGTVRAAYDYRSFGEQLDLLVFTRKVTENFTGKEKDDETQLDYFGARYFDPMLGMWTSVDPKRQFASPYLYVGNGYNPVNVVDPDGNAATVYKDGNQIGVFIPVIFSGEAATPENIAYIKKEVASSFTKKYGKYDVTVSIFELPEGANGGDPSGINKVTLWNGPAPECERGSCAHIGLEGSANIDMTGELRRFHVLHEIAHLLGLEDKYDYDTKKPYPTYENNLMGKAGQFDLKPEQIEEMWVPNSRKGSEGNNVYGPEK